MTDAAPGDATIQFSMLEAMAESLDVAVVLPELMSALRRPDA